MPTQHKDLLNKTKREQYPSFRSLKNSVTMTRNPATRPAQTPIIVI